MTEQEVLRDVCEKESKHGLYDINIGGLPVYSMIRGFVRYRIIDSYGLPIMNLKASINKWSIIKSLFVSFLHLIKLMCANKKCSSIYYAFARVDKVGEYFLDKFTDPIIEQCEIKGRYLIFDYGRGGCHPKPRVHSDSIIYLDLLAVISRLYGMLFYRFIYHKFRKEFDLLFQELIASFGLDFNKSIIIKEFASNKVYIRLLQHLFKKVSAERVIGPARAFMAAPFIAAKRQGMKTFELQHGITYGETVLYSGYRDEMVVPDYFLTFGDNNPKNVYGIDESRIINVGWAFQDYITNVSHERLNYGSNDVLVVSDPEVTRPMLNVIIDLAAKNPESTFYFRPHPHEIITQEHKDMIAHSPNVKIQDKSINITLVLQMFNLIVGENSTVIYEALAIRKKVGRLFYEGLTPLYTDESDRECFWEIRSQQDFIEFLKGDVNSKKSKCIYSSFDKNKYLKITGISE